MIALSRLLRAPWALCVLILLVCPLASAQERLCDPSFEDCYTPLLNAVRAETTGIDMAFYWSELPDLADAIIKRFQAGVPVRLSVEPRESHVDAGGLGPNS